MNLLLLLACVDPDADKPPVGDTGADTSGDTADDGDSTPPDTGDTTDTHTGDHTAETAESGDSRGDSSPCGSAETAAVDTSPPDTGPTTWSPGDDIPGWEDADCAETAGGRAYETVFPSLFAFSAQLAAGTGVDGPQYASVIVRDCVVFGCDTSTYDDTEPHARADLDGTWGAAPEPRGLGLWGPDAADPRHVTGRGVSPLEDWSDDAFGSFGVVTVCIARMRPDRVEGAIRVEIADDDSSLYSLNALYPTIVYRFPFSIALDERSGYDSTLPDSPADKPASFDAAHFTYDVPYDDAWPWDDITDPYVRAQVYDRYRPYNSP